MNSIRLPLYYGYNVHLAGHSFLLLPQRALLWPKYHILIIADAHIGKVTHFRKAGVALPVDAILTQMTRLKELIRSIEPKQVIFLGDLFHSDVNSEWEIFKSEILSLNRTSFILVRGNHDILPSGQYLSAGLEICDIFSTDGITFVHQATEEVSKFEICGHMHPGYLLKGKGKQSVRLPCLYKTNNKAILPAYGDFTGLFNIQPSTGEEVYLIAKDKIIPITF
ncbi:ligase-associated DNA damage response endonuclease PdeM [Schleiferia thermophila]|uniref:ligase-associated DNA damage response endonuclease PdeM n=1 Tax=Schleiferia thermophila TaxID=884107 RepID=UPI0009FE148D|nr:ligase-associated DNA damage response endonuclease PdeM [Schleiferia thermophila]